MSTMNGDEALATAMRIDLTPRAGLDRRQATTVTSGRLTGNMQPTQTVDLRPDLVRQLACVRSYAEGSSIRAIDKQLAAAV
jgi:hypothetical protein